MKRTIREAAKSARARTQEVIRVERENKLADARNQKRAEHDNKFADEADEADSESEPKLRPAKSRKKENPAKQSPPTPEDNSVGEPSVNNAIGMDYQDVPVSSQGNADNPMVISDDVSGVETHNVKWFIEISDDDPSDEEYSVDKNPSGHESEDEFYDDNEAEMSTDGGNGPDTEDDFDDGPKKKAKTNPKVTKKPAVAKKSADAIKKHTATPRQRGKQPPLSGVDNAQADEPFNDQPEVDASIPSVQAQPAKKAAPKAAATYKDAFDWKNGIKEDLKPISTLYEAFKDMHGKIMKLAEMQHLIKVLQQSKGALKVGTMCSGTDSPVLALSAFEHFFKLQDLSFPIHHAFSMEIAAFKQAFLALNFDPDVLFRNVCALFQIDQKSPEDVVGKFEMLTALGGMAVVPGDLDILIAGTCCVDFSIMNHAQKTLKGGGESGDTFFAMLAYAKVYRPRIIILENVAGAPWLKSSWGKKKGEPHGFDDEFDKIGYKAKFVKLDTKNYYIPQTRTRGYMISINIQDLSVEQRTRVDELLENWKNVVVDYLKRPASTPVSMWLLPSDDPRLVHSRTPWVDDLEKSRKPPRWDACQVNYASYRQNLGLGDCRPLTSWGTDGFFVLPDFFQQKHSFGLTERVLDTIDISHIRGINRGYDDRYYFRITELGQNIYRDKEQNMQGVASCQTPNAQQFIPSRGGRIIGPEALNIQGLPVDQLDISRLTQPEMQDLSGNAMTTTVVGAVTMAAVSTFAEFLNLKGDPSKASPSVAFMPAKAQKEKLTRQDSSTWSYEPLSLPEALAFVKKTRRLCYCEHRELTKDRQFQKCAVCLHTTCTSCGKNPPHFYEKLQPMAREDVRVFEKRLLKSLPMATKLFNLSKKELHWALDKFHSNNKAFIDGKTWDLIRARIQDALLSTVSLQSIRRSDIWEVFYESPSAKLVLTISSTEAKWEIFANVPEEPLGSILGKYLREFPIAQMFCDRDDLTQGDFQLWRPKVNTFDTTVSMHGPMAEVYENKIGIVAKQETYQYSRCTLSIDKFNPIFFPVDIRGEYELTTNCGQPFNFMFVHKESMNDPEKRVGMFLNQKIGHGQPGSHPIVIADNTRRLEVGKHREIKGRFATKFRFPNVRANRNEEDQQIIDFTIESTGQKLYPQQMHQNVATTISVDGTWGTFPRICLNKSDKHQTEYHLLPCDIFIPASQCDSQQTLFTCDAHMSAGMSRDFPANQFIPLSKANEFVFLQDLKYLAQGGLIQEGHKEGGEWRTLDPNASHTPCQKCSPKSPILLWALEKKKLVAYEDPQQAAEYEKACKRCPPCLLAAFRRNDENFAEIVIDGNPVALSHKALATLIPQVKEDVRISTEYRLITDADANPRPKKVPFTIPLNQCANNRQQPRNFSYDLRPQQLDAVSWCCEQESGDGKTWKATAVAEANLNAVGYRLEARAVADTKVSGGVLAFDVAFGKTPVILALTQLQKTKDAKWAKEKQSKPKSIRSKATLVVVPDHLPGQWESEVRKFIDSKLKVLVIQDAKDWNKKKFNVRDFKEADIIIIGMTLIDHSSYLRDLANLAGVVELNKTHINKQNRAKSAWRTKAAQNIQDNMAELLADKDEFVENLKTLYEESIASCRQNAAPVPSKRLVGAKYAESKEVIATSSKKKRKLDATRDSTVDTLDNRDKYFQTFEETPLDEWVPVLEMFEFARVVIDEYTYLGDLDQAIPFIRSRSRWILSGTPDLATASDIFKMGRLLGAYVGSDDYFTTSIEQWKKMYQDMTRAEDYQSFLATKSAAYSYGQMQIAQEFLNDFARKDEAAIGHIKIEEHILLMYLTLYQWAIYKESEQRVTNLDFDQKAHVKSVGGHSIKIYQEAVHVCKDPREVLIFRSAHSQPLPGLEIGAVKEKVEDDVKTARKEQLRIKMLHEKKRTKVEERAQAEDRAVVAADWDTDVSDIDENDLIIDDEDEENPEDENASQNTAQPIEVPLVAAVPAEAMCKKILNHRKSELAVLLKDLLLQLRKATWLQCNQEDPGEQKFNKWKATASDHKDPDVLAQLTHLITKAAQTPNEWFHFYRRQAKEVRVAEKLANNSLPNLPSGMVGKGNNSHLTQLAASLRDVVILLRKLCDALECQIVSIRFIDALCHVIDDGIVDCAGKCGNQLHISENFTLLTSCGHGICDGCLLFKPHTCPACHATYQPHQVITGAQLQKFNKSSLMHIDDDEQTETPTLLNYGEKIDCCMKFIQEVPEDECVLLFVQFELIHNEVLKALDAAEIDYIDLKNSKKKSEALVEYQSGDRKVLLLDIDDASASGSNLTCANHIIFLTPYFVKGSNSQEKWKATMTQAVGRARRWGQNKTVNVYHFITAETIDADIFQMRHRKKLISFDDDERFGQLVDLDDPDEIRGPLSSAIWHLLWRREY